MKIPFNRPYLTGNELTYIQQAVDAMQLSGNGIFTKRCHEWLEKTVGCQKAFLTHSGTAALEMAAILLDIKPGDEVIMPSFTFVSTANAFVLRGATPVFVDIRPDTLNLDVSLIEQAITPKTRAIVPVHYNGVACDMERIMAIAKRHDLCVIEDAAHGIMAKYNGQPLGSFGHMAALSFHETKNIISGEGGALLINDPQLVKRAAIVWEKGTNRAEYFLGLVDKYTWQDVGSSFLPSEMVAAFLWAQMEHAQELTERRLALWNRYHSLLEGLERDGFFERPCVPAGCSLNAHIYYLLVSSQSVRDELLARLNSQDVVAVFHYIPLHSAPAGKRFGRQHGQLKYTDDVSGRLIRLPLFAGLSEADVDKVVDCVARFFRGEGQLQSRAGSSKKQEQERSSSFLHLQSQ